VLLRLKNCRRLMRSCDSKSGFMSIASERLEHRGALLGQRVIPAFAGVTKRLHSLVITSSKFKIKLAWAV
jgi:hypothetical protein